MLVRRIAGAVGVAIVALFGSAGIAQAHGGGGGVGGGGGHAGGGIGGHGGGVGGGHGLGGHHGLFGGGGASGPSCQPVIICITEGLF
jgi:hypothetical protein